MTMCDGATLDIDDVGRQPEFLHDRERYDSEGLVDFNTLDLAIAPAGARKRLFDGRYRTEAKPTRFDCGDTVRHEPRDGRQTTSICPSFACQHHRRRGRIQPWSIAGSDRAAIAEDRLQLTQRLDCRVRPIMLVRLERARTLPPRNFNRLDLVREFSAGLGDRDAVM